MKVSLNWLGDHVDFSALSIPELDDLLTFAGIEVEGVEQRGVEIDRLVVAEILSSEKHPDADKLSVCRVDDGAGPSKPRQIVCGAKNYAVGDKVPLALPGCQLGGGFEIKEGKLRGVESLGMLCSGSELGLEESSEGLLILDPAAKPGTPVRELFERDTIFELEITPNRPDLLSYTGIARELAALTGRALKSRASYAESEVPERSSQPEEVAIADPVACPYYTARIIRGVKVGPSPAWLQEKLAAAGLRPINNIVDITNFVLLEMGQPLHAFDMAKLNGGILVRPAQQGEEFLALDGETYALEAGDLVIADQSRGVGVDLRLDLDLGLRLGLDLGRRTTRLLGRLVGLGLAGLRRGAAERGDVADDRAAQGVEGVAIVRGAAQGQLDQVDQVTITAVDHQRQLEAVLAGLELAGDQAVDVEVADQLRRAGGVGRQLLALGVGDLGELDLGLAGQQGLHLAVDARGVATTDADEHHREGRQGRHLRRPTGCWWRRPGTCRRRRDRWTSCTARSA